MNMIVYGSADNAMQTIESWFIKCIEIKDEFQKCVSLDKPCICYLYLLFP